MGVDPAYLAERWAWRISLNPITIDFTRKVKTRNPRGGFDITEDPISVEASYVEPSRLLELERQTGGAAQVDTSTSGALLVAADQPPLIGDPPERDEFMVPGQGRFRVRRVRPLTWMAETYGYVAYLERIV